jgi:transcriptional regulator with XRE-family HTH domain
MEFILGDDNPKVGLERVVHSFKPIIDWSKVNLPRYNPCQFELARNLDGLTKAQFAKTAGLSTRRYTDIEKGDVVPTEVEVDAITGAQTHVLRGFFEQWHETETDFSKVIPVPVAIDYYKFKIFRDINPPRMKVLK